MGIADDAVEIRAQGWRTLAALHGLIDTALERALQNEHGLSVVEYTVLDALSRQDGWHMRMQQLGRATALSASATTRLVNRLEDRGLLTRILCQDDRRGIYTELTADGVALLERAQPTHERALADALAAASASLLVFAQPASVTAANGSVRRAAMRRGRSEVTLRRYVRPVSRAWERRGVAGSVRGALRIRVRAASR